MAQATFTVWVEKRRRVPLEGGGNGFTTVSDGPIKHRVTVAVDLEGLAQRYAERAVRSKRSKATACGGLIVVTKVS